MQEHVLSFLLNDPIWCKHEGSVTWWTTSVHIIVKTNKAVPTHLKSYFFKKPWKLVKNDLPPRSDSPILFLLSLSSPLLLSWIQRHTPSLLSTVTASFHSSSVSHVSPCAFMLCWTKARHHPDCECVCLSAFLGACVVPVCGVETKKRWQQAMVLTQKWVLQLVCVYARACLPRASPRYDGDSWGATGRCSAPFRPDALVTLWSCSLLLTSLSSQREVLRGWGGFLGRLRPVAETWGTATLPWVRRPQSRVVHLGISRCGSQLQTHLNIKVDQGSVRNWTLLRHVSDTLRAGTRWYENLHMYANNVMQC